MSEKDLEKEVRELNIDDTIEAVRDIKEDIEQDRDIDAIRAKFKDVLRDIKEMNVK